MKPSIGRIIHVVTSPIDGRHAPAIVTFVHEDGCVNANVFQDPLSSFLMYAPTWAMQFDESGQKPGTWHYPERSEAVI